MNFNLSLIVSCFAQVLINGDFLSSLLRGRLDFDCNKYCAVPENICTPPTEGIGISWGGGAFCKAKKFIDLNWNFQRGGGLRKNLFHEAGMDNFWNYTF